MLVEVDVLVEPFVVLDVPDGLVVGSVLVGATAVAVWSGDTVQHGGSAALGVLAKSSTVPVK